MLSSVLTTVYQQLTAFVGLESFWAKFESIFGTEYDIELAQSLRSQWQIGDFGQLPTIKVISEDILGGARGAYATSNNTIYLSDWFVATASSEALGAVVIEEIGHFVDAQVNRIDTQGDEGELFSAIVRAISLNSSELVRIKQENDQARIVVDGEVINVERNSVITLTVTTEIDENDKSSNGNGLSLRDAILIANSDISNDYVIEVKGGKTYFLTIGLGDSNANQGDLDIVNDVNITIRATGIGMATINASPLGDDRVFDILSGGTLTLDKVEVMGGNTTSSGQWGGGIANSGNLTIKNSRIFNNYSNNPGGGISNIGNLNVYQSVINDNYSSWSGGGIFNASNSNAVIVQSTISNNTTIPSSVNASGGGIRSDGNLTLIQSTISNNSSYIGGGLSHARGNLIISNSTFTGNSALSSGGGIFYQIGSSTGSNVMLNSTVTNNTADSDSNGGGGGGGIGRSGNVGNNLLVKNSIIAGNFQSPSNINSSFYLPDLEGDFTGSTYNLIGSLGSGNGVTISTINNIINPLSGIGLGPLLNNGGLTFTHTLLSGSPAINAGLNSLIDRDFADSDNDGNITESMPHDQRGMGYNRVSGSSVDIGAFEVQATVTSPSITLAVSPASVLENGTSNLVYTFTRTGVTNSALTVKYSIAGTATSTDYTGATPGTGKTITFAAGSATATLTIDPTADTTIEANETVALTLASGTGYIVGTTTAVTGTITNDDFPSITLAVSPASVLEDGTSNLVYTFTRTGVTNSALTVKYSIAGTATSTDYTGATPGTGKTITFAVGSATATLTIDPTADTTIEANETVALTLASGTGYIVGTTTAVTGTITNDDPKVNLALNYSGISENSSSNFSYTFTRTGATTSSLTVNYSIGGTATSTDYTGAIPGTGKTITFAAGSSTAILSLDPTADMVIETNETISLQLSTGTGYTLGTTAAQVATIINDDGTRRHVGTSGKDVLLGTAGSDYVIGGAESDNLTGGAGGDTFSFATPNLGNDRINDYAPGVDMLLVSAQRFGGGLVAGDTITAVQFSLGSSATAASQRFIYNSANGALFFDVDGNGTQAAKQIATLNTSLALTFEDIFVG